MLSPQPLKRIYARTLLQYTTRDLWNILCIPFIIVFDDQRELVTSAKEALFSSYFWDFHRAYPNTPLLSEHHVQWVLKGKFLGTRTHRELLQNIFWTVVETYHLHTPELRDHAQKMIYEITNEIHNDLTIRIEDYVVSIDALDFLDVMCHPKIQEVNDNITTDKASIANANTVILDTISKDPGLDHNILAFVARAGTVRIHQVLQCVGPRGYPTDVDGTILPIPVTRGYFQGMRTFYNLLTESRGAAKAMAFSEAPLEDAEYFARKLQLITMPVERLHRVDCGSEDYLFWQRVRPPQYRKGKMIYPGDLVFLNGKYYLDEENNTLKTVTPLSVELYDRSIQLRSGIHCHHPDPHGICHICFGQLAANIPSWANLGHVCAAFMTQQTSQNVLSTKHHEASSSAEPIVLDEVTSRIFTVGKGGTSYLFKKEYQGRDLTLIISQAYISGLTDILLVSDVSKISPARIGSIDMIEIEYRHGNRRERFPGPIHVNQKTRSAILTREFLQYVKAHPWHTDEYGNFVFDMSKWDYSKPVLKLPDTEYNYSLHSKQIAAMIEARIDDITERLKPESPEATLTELSDLVNSKLHVNLALLEVVVYAIMVNNVNGGYGLARKAPQPALGVFNLTLPNRSLGAVYTYEGQAGVMSSPSSFFLRDRCDHPLDVMVAPREVVETYTRKQ